MNALRQIHAVLVPGGSVIDTQPVSAEPPVESRGRRLTALDMHDWAHTIELVDLQVREAIRDGLFALDDEQQIIVTDTYDDGAELVEEVRAWAGTRVDDQFADRVSSEQGPVHLHQDVMVRVLRAL